MPFNLILTFWNPPKGSKTLWNRLKANVSFQLDPKSLKSVHVVNYKTLAPESGVVSGYLHTCMYVMIYGTLAPESEVVWWFFHIDIHVCIKLRYLRPKMEVVWWFLGITYMHVCGGFSDTHSRIGGGSVVFQHRHACMNQILIPLT